MEYGHPRGNVFYRKMARNYPCIVRGEGIYLYDENGKRFIDGSGARADSLPKARRPTRPTRASKERRIESKKHRQATKRLRGRPGAD